MWVTKTLYQFAAAAASFSHLRTHCSAQVKRFDHLCCKLMLDVVHSDTESTFRPHQVVGSTLSLGWVVTNSIETKRSTYFLSVTSSKRAACRFARSAPFISSHYAPWKVSWVPSVAEMSPVDIKAGHFSPLTSALCNNIRNLKSTKALIQNRHLTIIIFLWICLFLQ